MEKIIYFARKLKSFSFDDIFLLAEISKEKLKIILDELVEKGLLKKLSTGYIFIEQNINSKKVKKITQNKKEDYGIFIPNTTLIENLSFYQTVNKFLNEYVAKFCTVNTVQTYKSLFKNHILPYFKNKNFEDIDNNEITRFYQYCNNKNMSSKRLKNTLALLKEFLQFAKDKGLTNFTCDFQVRRLTSKNEFNLSRVIFK